MIHNMKKIFLSLSIVSVGTICVAMDKKVQLPEASVLKARLSAEGFEHFVETTGIDINLAHKKIFPVGVAIYVTKHLNEYNACLNELMVSNKIKMPKHKIIEVILEDNPDVIAYLKSVRLL